MAFSSLLAHFMLAIPLATRVVVAQPCSEPSILPSIQEAYNAFEVVAQGDLVVMASSTEGVFLFDVSDPEQIAQVAVITVPDSCRDIEIVGNVVCVLVRNNGALFYDVSNPASPALILSYNPEGAGAFLHADSDGSKLWVSSSGPDGLIAFTITDGPGVSVTQSVAVSRDISVQGLAVSNGLAAVTILESGQLPGILLLDVQDQASPIELAYLELDFSANDLGFTQDNSYLVTTDGSLQLYDLSDMANIIKLPPFDITILGSGSSPELYGLCVAGNTVYATGSTRRAYAIDITVPELPTVLAVRETMQFSSGVSLIDKPRGLAVIGATAYVAIDRVGLQLIDIDPSSNAAVVGNLPLAGNSRGVSVLGEYAYVASGSAGLRVIDVRNKGVPVEVSSLSLGFDSHRVTVVGDRAYVQDGLFFRMDIVDIADPLDPSLLGTFNAPGTLYEAEVVGNLAYLAAGAWGLLVVDVTDPA